MSKKTKRLEKENLTLTRKHDLTNRNILEMAEERTKREQDFEALKKKNEKLTSIINQMQKQGRGVAGGLSNMTEASMEGQYGEGDLEGTESEFDEYGDDEAEDGDEDGSEEGDYDEDEEELHVEEPKLFGPVPPPPPPAANGVAATNGEKHVHQL